MIYFVTTKELDYDMQKKKSSLISNSSKSFVIWIFLDKYNYFIINDNYQKCL